MREISTDDDELLPIDFTTLLPPRPRSVLPDPPPELSRQARALIEAAGNGTPFMEICGPF